MQNSKVRFKLYKAKKNWVSAGLVTTAVLAGLTLGSVKNNDVVAHADSNVQTTATANQKQNVTQDQYNQQQQKVANDQQNVNNAQKDVDAAQQAVNNAQNANENAAKVAEANQAWKDAESAWGNANRDYQNAHKATATAKSASDEAARYQDNWNKNEADVYNKLQQGIADQTAKKSAAEAKVNNAKQAIKNDGQAFDEANAQSNQAQAKLNQIPNDAIHQEQRTKLQRQLMVWKPKSSPSMTTQTRNVNSLLNKLPSSTMLTSTSVMLTRLWHLRALKILKVATC